MDDYIIFSLSVEDACNVVTAVQCYISHLSTIASSCFNERFKRSLERDVRGFKRSCEVICSQYEDQIVGDEDA